jgi:CDP-glycerol glycerophosphotransferase
LSSSAPGTSPKLSVVVPYFNVEDFIEECLASLAAQTLTDLEVIMVDDGSTDGSVLIAERYARQDPRFRVVTQENQGLGPARNTGVRHAKGKYLTFVDSDDVVPAKAFAQMVGSLERTGSDFATGNVMRFNDARRWQSGMYGKLFQKDHAKTHITREPELIRDRIVCNKVFRRSFWDAQGFEFPGRFYEDTPVVFPAHVNAKSVDVLRDHVYEWRVRHGSITQNRFEIDNLRARLDMVTFVRDYATEKAPALVPEWDAYVLENDFVALVGTIAEADESDREEILELAIREVGVVAPEAIKKQKAHRRLMVHALQHRMVPELLALHALTPRQLAGTRAVRRGRLRRRWYAQYTCFEDPARDLPADLFDVTDEIKVQGRANRAWWQDGKLHITGHSRLPFLEMATPDSSDISLWLRNRTTRTRVSLPVTRVQRPDVTADTNQENICYDAAGWSVVVDPARLGSVPGDWELFVEVGNAGLKRTERVANPWMGRDLWPADGPLGDGLHLTPIAAVNGRFLIRVHRPEAVLTGSAVEGDDLVLTGWVDGKPTGVHATVSDGTAEATGRLETVAQAGRRHAFTARLPLVSVVRGGRRPLDLIDWDIALTGTGADIKLFPAGGLPERRYALGDDEIALTRTRYGGVRLVERLRRPVVSSLAWSGDALTLSGDLTGTGERPGDLVLRHRVTGEEQLVPISWDDDGRFTVRIEVRSFDLFGARLPLGNGYWRLFARGAGDEDVSVVVGRFAIVGMPDRQVVGMHEYLPSVYNMDSLELQVRPALTAQERGAYAQRRLREEVYPELRTRPVRDMVLMDSFDSRQYSDSPRAMAEELIRRGSPYEIVWVSADGQFEVPEGSRVVLRNSLAHYEAMARARLVVANNPMPPGYVRREGQTYVQTWHGTPLKKIGFDIEVWRGSADYLERFAADVAQWDFLVSPQPWSTPIWRRAFRYDGEILEVGYPRNDLLNRPELPEVAASVRQRLGIPADARVVLYAPTWRDDVRKTGGVGLDLNLDLAEFERRLGPDHYLLVRGHINVREAVKDATQSPRILDVSKYPDIVELYAIADVLITDYSSVMFDYAVTRRPMLFFTYDLEHYRDDLRGFYFDFEAEAPGPLLRTNDELFDALSTIDKVATDYADAYKSFTDRFCPLDDGKAAARILDRVLP